VVLRITATVVRVTDLTTIEPLHEPEVHGLRRYWAVLGAPGVRPLVVAGAVGRLPLGMMSLAVVLLSRSVGISYATAGAWVGAMTLGSAVSTPVIGRAIDRLGEAAVLAPLALAYPLVTVGTTVAIHGRANAVLVGALALLTGAALPPLGPAMRALWPRLLGADLRNTAFAFEATVQECAFVVGPLIAATLASVAPVVALLAAGAFGGAGALGFAVFAQRQPRPVPLEAGPRGQALRSAGVQTVMIASLATGAAFGAIEVAMPAFAEQHGDRSAGGICLAAFALGSMLGGVWFGSHPLGVHPRRAYGIALGVLAGALALPLIAFSIPMMSVLMLLAGIPIAPGFAASYVLLDEIKLPGAEAETFAWLTTSIIAGAAAGSAVGGAAIGGIGYRASVGLAVALAAFAAFVAFARRASL
jgi:MFS family permease